jgi:hypothetical protein
MLTPNPSIWSVIFWQWINQSYNIGVNHANRNASNSLSNETIAKTYISAVIISCSVAVGLGKFAQNATRFNEITRKTIERVDYFIIIKLILI